MPTRLGIRIVAIGVGSVAYVLGTHWLMTRPGGSPWNVVGVLSPMLLAIGFGAWQAGQRLLALGAAGIVAALCLQAVLGVQVSAQALYVAQHMGIHLFLAVLFGSTLRAGRQPLITTLAERVHRVFTPDMVAYTRKVTLAWTLYFIAMAVLSLLLYAFAPFGAWALFANLLTPLAIAAMFGAEYLLRYHLHPEFERTSVADAVRSYMQGTDTP
ncbi:MAG: hypothetical protein H7306_12445 [Bacteriovorax sp.]|nr:hypothetical protein [Rhizobacter sp.]